MDRPIAEAFPPGEYIRDEMVARGWSQRQLAEALGRTEPKVSEIIHGKRAITTRTAKELAAAFGTSAEVWLNLEMRWRLWRDRVPEEELDAIRERAARIEASVAENPPAL